jgi:hypothetical protein
MYLIRYFRKKSKRKREHTYTWEPHINIIEVDVFDTQRRGVHAGKVDVNRIPVEIWQLIFEHCTERQDPILESILQTKRSDMSITLSHVCRLFRSIALSMPSLWSTLDLSLSKEQLSMFIERSLQAPITIDSTNEFRLLPRHAPAFRSIHNRIVNIKNPIFLEEFLDFELFSCSHLQYLVSGSESVLEDEQNLKRVLDDFKELKSLTWACPFGLWENSSVHFLTRYALTELRVTAVMGETIALDLLRSCPLLERVYLVTTRTIEDENRQKVSLPRLKDLEFSSFQYADWLWKIQGPPVLDKFSIHFFDSAFTLTHTLTLPFRVVSLQLDHDLGF